MSELAICLAQKCCMFFSHPPPPSLREPQVHLDLGIRNCCYFQSTYSQVLFSIVLIALFPLVGEELWRAAAQLPLCTSMWMKIPLSMSILKRVRKHHHRQNPRYECAAECLPGLCWESQSPQKHQWKLKACCLKYYQINSMLEPCFAAAWHV